MGGLFEQARDELKLLLISVLGLLVALAWRDYYMSVIPTREQFDNDRNYKSTLLVAAIGITIVATLFFASNKISK